MFLWYWQRKVTLFKEQVYVAYKNISPIAPFINSFQSICQVLTEVYIKKNSSHIAYYIASIHMQIDNAFFLEGRCLLDPEVDDRIIRNVHNYSIIESASLPTRRICSSNRFVTGQSCLVCQQQQ